MRPPRTRRGRPAAAPARGRPAQRRRQRLRGRAVVHRGDCACVRRKDAEAPLRRAAQGPPLRFSAAGRPAQPTPLRALRTARRVRVPTLGPLGQQKDQARAGHLARRRRGAADDRMRRDRKRRAVLIRAAVVRQASWRRLTCSPRRARTAAAAADYVFSGAGATDTRRRRPATLSPLRLQQPHLAAGDATDGGGCVPSRAWERAALVAGAVARGSAAIVRDAPMGVVPAAPWGDRELGAGAAGRVAARRARPRARLCARGGAHRAARQLWHAGLRDGGGGAAGVPLLPLADAPPGRRHPADGRTRPRQAAAPLHARPPGEHHGAGAAGAAERVLRHAAGHAQAAAAARAGPPPRRMHAAVGARRHGLWRARQPRAATHLRVAQQRGRGSRRGRAHDPPDGRLAAPARPASTPPPRGWHGARHGRPSRHREGLPAAAAVGDGCGAAARRVRAG
mmetsp:Transcript_27651/g.70669  ORF Transcript_27651/g.70669 Transcript_27651/m.70669 type:complete len:452 (+) Transcript_27651:658-2013(+)